MDNGLIIEDIKVGTGEVAKSGDTIKADYKGYLEDGTVFDSSYDRGEAAIFPIGIDFLIQGWEEGIPGMQEGGIRKLTIPGDLGYGEAGNPQAGIPGNAILIFEIELLEIL
ncbi:FKBP-type peptidyl-prolyl cis-trans isomerase [Patescibacteria group bacterium]|nr:FKBP-type peptidyl-prolyl cis-trans isomerase [Patescibacteria group bacterium]